MTLNPLMPVIRLSGITLADLEAPLNGRDIHSYRDLHSIYQQSANGEERLLEKSAYSLLADVSSFMLHPSDRAMPYGPIDVQGNKRSAIPSDFAKEQSIEFSQIAPKISDHLLQARLADVAWINNPKDHKSAALAIVAFNNVAEKAISKSSKDAESFQDNSSEIRDYLLRALWIARRIGENKPGPKRTRELLIKLRNIARKRDMVGLYRDCVVTDLDFGVSEPEKLASQVSMVARLEGRRSAYESEANFWKICARAHLLAKNEPKKADYQIKEAKSYVKQADVKNAPPFQITHNLMRAIEKYREVSKIYRPAGVIEILQARLITAQRDIRDYMHTHTHTTNIRKEVQIVRSWFKKLDFLDSIKDFSLLHTPKPYKHYEDEAMRHEREFFLSAIFATSVHDFEGKTKFNAAGGEIDSSNKEAIIRFRAIQSMSLDRQLLVASAIEPARSIMRERYMIDDEKLLSIMEISPFVPAGHEHLFALGFSRMFAGAFAEAACLLIPQLENSLRYVLKQNGVDVSIILPNSTQEDIGLSVLFGRLRPKLVKVLNEAVVFDLELLFNHKAGPNFRNMLAHGTIQDAYFWSADAIYSCWIIYFLTVRPLCSNWPSIKKALGDMA